MRFKVEFIFMTLGSFFTLAVHYDSLKEGFLYFLLWLTLHESLKREEIDRRCVWVCVGVCTFLGSGVCNWWRLFLLQGSHCHGHFHFHMLSPSFCFCFASLLPSVRLVPLIVAAVLVGGFLLRIIMKWPRVSVSGERTLVPLCGSWFKIALFVPITLTIMTRWPTFTGVMN